jgi:hypothetical protein
MAAKNISVFPCPGMLLPPQNLFQFQERRQLLLGPHDKPPPVVAAHPKTIPFVPAIMAGGTTM